MDAGLQGEQGTRRPRINAGIEESRTACLRARGGLFRAFSFFSLPETEACALAVFDQASW